MHRSPSAVVALLCSLAVGFPGEGGELPADERDPSVPPCEDFYQHANGGWLARAQIPADRSSWSSYDEVEARTEETLRSILAELVAADPAGLDPYSGAVATLYGACMDSEARERAGITPLRHWLDSIDSIDSRERLAGTFGELHRVGVRFPFRLYGTPDPLDSSTIVAELWQNGLRLPVPAAYQSEVEEAVALRDAYRRTLSRLFALTGSTPEDAAGDAERTLRLETALSAVTMPRSQARDPGATTHRRTREQLAEALPGFHWDAYFLGLSFPPPAVFNLGQPAYFAALGELLASEPPVAWQAYLRAQLLLNAAPYLGSEARQAIHSLRAVLTGVEEPPPLARSCIDATRDFLPEILGKVYMDRIVDEHARQRIAAMAEHLLAVMGERISAAAWMDEPTRKAALAKLDSLDLRLVGPQVDPPIAGLELVRGDFAGSAIAAARWSLDDGLHRIGGPVDDRRWPLPPYSVTGAYSASLNLVVYPAAKFQPPFFDPAASDAVNYGAIGATVAHEILHAFDDQGRKFDAEGNLRDWWTAATAQRFEERAERLRRQVEAELGGRETAVDGALTLGENIADLGGLTIAYHALQRARAADRSSPTEQRSAAQQFFTSWARNWREVSTPELARTRLASDVHAPSRWRTNGPLSNLPEFAAAFGCSPADRMVRPPEERITIW